jgi:deoxyribodipyrimidine photo-lyase
MRLNLFWFRRDLRTEDNSGLFHALNQNKPVQCVFLFDTEILSALENKTDARVTFLNDTLRALDKELQAWGGFLDVRYGSPVTVWQQLLDEYQPEAVYSNRDYEPYARKRDVSVGQLCKEKGIEFIQYKDHVIFETTDVVKSDGSPYTVFTPYKRRWLEKLQGEGGMSDAQGPLRSFPSQGKIKEGALNQHRQRSLEWPSLNDMGFNRSNMPIPPKEVSQAIIALYDKNRNFPSVDGTSKLGIHFRFGTISIRDKARKAMLLNETFLSELVWRDFYSMILWHFPHVASRSFRPEYDEIAWRNNEMEFTAWCQGMTGYPIVDAGMRELLATGYMHNRVRMIVASFLTKHLLIDWRWGEAWFAAHLLDFDLSSNNGGWQWAAGCGTDAAPYFRVFSPDAQTEKFDKDNKYIRKWIPEFGTSSYPRPIVDHKMARERCLLVFKEGLEKGRG